MKNILTLCALFLASQMTAQLFTTYTTDDGLINNTVNCLVVDNDDNIWFGTQEGISKFDGNTTWTNFDVNTSPDLVSNTIKAIAVDSDNNIWLGTDEGLNKFDGTNWTTYTEADGLADDRVRYIRQAPNGAIYIGNNDGLSILENGTFTNYTDEIPFGGINFVAFDNMGNAWLGSPLAGILVFDGTNFTAITEDDGLLSDKVRSIAIDNNNHKWIGTADGMSVFSSQNNFITHHEAFFELPPPDELTPVEDVLADESGRIWVGVYVDYLVTEGGVALYANSNWLNYDVNDGLAGPVVRRLDMDSQENLWVATSTGASKISGAPTPTIDVAIQQAINIAPNPSNGRFQLDVPQDLVGTTYAVYNSVGILIKQGNISALKSTIALEKAAKGLYFLSINGVYTSKIIVD